jgi:hypothetical protein
LILSSKARNQLKEAAFKKERDIDLSKFGENPDPCLMDSPEKRKYSQIVFARSNAVQGMVRAAMKRVSEVKGDI